MSRSRRAAASRICQTDTPAARATTSSSLRDRLRNAIIEPNSTANGNACSAKVGVRRNESSGHERAVASRRVAGTAQHFDQIDRVDEHENRRERRNDRAREAIGEIERERWADHAGLVRQRGRARTPTAAGGRSAPARRGRRRAGSPRRNIAADGSPTDSVVAAIPSMRTPKKARIAPPIATPASLAGRARLAERGEGDQAGDESIERAGQRSSSSLRMWPGSAGSARSCASGAISCGGRCARAAA